MRTKPSVAVIGLGMWGTQLTRVAINTGASVSGFDTSPAARRAAKKRFPGVTVRNTYADILTDNAIESVIIATPQNTHVTLAIAALTAGKHVLIEKPMAHHPREAAYLTQTAAKRNRVIMVDYTYVFSPALNKVKELINANAFGTIRRIESTRYSGRPQQHSTIFTDFAPHDVSIAHYLAGCNPTSVRTLAENPAATPVPDQAIIELSFPGPLRYLAALSWDTTTKIRRILIIGTKSSAHIRWTDGKETLTIYRNSAHTRIQISQKEPLLCMLMHFFTCIKNARTPITDVSFGTANSAVIAALTASWKRNGARVPVQIR